MNIARKVTLGALFLVPFLGLVIASDLFFPFITGKGFWFRILIEIAAGGWLVLMAFSSQYRPRISLITGCFVALVAWMFVADLFAVNPHKAFWSNFERMDGFVTLIHLLLFFLVAGSVFTRSLWQKWWLTFLAAAGIVCTYALLQLAGVFPIHQGGVRVDATMGNAAYLAAYLLFVIAIAGWQASVARGHLRYALILLIPAATFILFESATRGAILGALVGVIVAAGFWTLQAGSQGRKIGASIAVAVLVIVGGFFVVRDTEFVRGDPTLARLASISLADGATRFTIWELALKGATERPVFGWGHEGFNNVFNKNFKASLYAQEPWFDRAHNIYMDWLIAGGVPALLLFLALMGGLLRALVRRTKDSVTESAVLLGATVAYLFQGLFVFDNLLTYIPLVALLAYAHSTSPRQNPILENRTIALWITQSVIVPVVLIGTLLLIWNVNVSNMLAARDLVYAASPSANPTQNIALFRQALARSPFATQEIRERLIIYAVGQESAGRLPEEAKTALFTYARDEMNKELERAPQDARLRLQQSLLLRTFGDFEGARKEVALALAVSDKKQLAFIEKGMIEWQAKEYAAAKSAFDAAYELDPSFKDLATYAAAGAILVGERQAAEALLLERYGTTTVDSGPLLLAHYETRNFDEMIAIWKLRVEKANGDANTRFGLAIAYAAAGRLPDARAEIAAIIQKYPDRAQEGLSILKSLNDGTYAY